MLETYFRDGFLRFQKGVIPRARRFTPEQDEESVRIVTKFLQARPASIRIKVIGFLLLADLMTILFLGQRQKVIQFLFDSSVPLLRKGFWGVNTLAKMSVFCQTSLHADLNYHPKELLR